MVVFPPFIGYGCFWVWLFLGMVVFGDGFWESLFHGYIGAPTDLG